MRPVVVYARDPGSANQMIAVCELLMREAANPHVMPLRRLFGIGDLDRPGLRVHGQGSALAMFDVAGLSPLVGAPTEAMVESAGGILTGLDDVDDPTPRMLWKQARQAGIPSAAFCDNDENLAIRLRDRDVAIAPDMVFVLSDRGYAELSACGIPRIKVELIPDLHLRRLSGRPRDADARARQRKAWGVLDYETVWLYAGVIRREFANLRAIGPEDEIKVLELLIDALARASAGPVTVIVRPHPRDPAGKYDPACRASALPARVSTAGSPSDAYLAADFIVSLSEAVRNEARVLGQKAFTPDEALKAIQGISG